MFEQTSEFRKALEQAKSELSNQFKDLMDAIQREQNVDRRILNEARSSTYNEQQTARAVTSMGDKLQDLLSIQTTMLTELTNINSSIKRLGENNLVGAGGQSPMQQQQQTGGGALGWLFGGAAVTTAAAATVFGGGDGGGTTGSGDRRTTRGGGGRTPAPTGTTGSGSVSGDISREEMAFELYSAYRRAGFSHMQARGLVGEVNRENAFNPDMIFGSHTEPADASITNYGPLSYNQQRGQNLLEYLRQEGLLEENGSITRSRETLDAFAQFAMAEMTPVAEWSEDIPGVGSHADMQKVQDFINNPDISGEESRRTMGGVGGYVAWARGQDVLRNGRSFDWRAHEARTIAGSQMVDAGDFEERFERESATPETITPTSVSERVRQLEEETGFQVTPLQLEDGTYTFITSRPISDETGDFTRSPQDIFNDYGVEGFLTEEEDAARERAIDVTIPTTTRYSGEGSFPGINSINEELESFDWSAIGEGETVAIEGKRYFIGYDDNGVRTIFYSGRGEFSAQDRTPIAAINDSGDIVDYYGAEGSAHYEGYEDYSHADMAVVLERGFVPSSEEPTSVFGTPIPDTTISGGEGDDGVSGDSSGDTLTQSPVFTDTSTLAGVMETSDFITPEEEEALVADLRRLLAEPMNVSLNMTAAGMAASPEVQAALAEQAAAGQEEGAPGGGGGGYGGGGGAATPPTPQIQSSIIGRFGWGENLPKYYGLEDTIRTNMLT